MKGWNAEKWKWLRAKWKWLHMKWKRQNTYSLKFRVLYGLAFAQAFWGIVIGLTERMIEQVMFCIVMAVVVIAIVTVTDVDVGVEK